MAPDLRPGFCQAACGAGPVITMKPAYLASTATELLSGLHDSDNWAAWEEFDHRYRPILVGFLRRMGLGEADAADVAQETLACFVRDYRAERYCRQQGRLRNWLVGIARYKLLDLRRESARRREVRGESAIEGLPDDNEAEALWDEEERRVIFERAVSELRQTARFSVRTIEAFDRVVLKNEPVEAVASELGLTAQEIYNAKNRVVQRLREIVKRFQDDFVGS